ncbi:MAG: hypothetical protein ACFFEF_12335 [Candidatus Thorarchaeota archaeon]
MAKDQIEQIDTSGATYLSYEQLALAADAIASPRDFENHAEHVTEQLEPLSCALFVFNPAVWRIMERKQDSPNTMLPTATIPWFYWKHGAITTSNPHGVRRDALTSGKLNVVPSHHLEISGPGGDFCGILEGKIVEQEVGPRAIIAPTFPGSDTMVPKYEPRDISVRVSLDKIDARLYPSPRNDVDYAFCEHPRVFFEHGFSIKIDGSGVRLRVDKRREQNLFGETLLLVGRKWQKEALPEAILAYHIWLAALFKIIT